MVLLGSDESLADLAPLQADSWIVELDWQQFHQQADACSWLGDFAAAVAYPGEPQTQALLLRNAAARWPATSLISIPWLLSNTTQVYE